VSLAHIADVGFGVRGPQVDRSAFGHRLEVIRVPFGAERHAVHIVT